MVDPFLDEIIYCYGEYQDIFQDMQDVQFVEGFSDMDKWTGDKKRLVFIDDLMAETDDRVTKLFYK